HHQRRLELTAADSDQRLAHLLEKPAPRCVQRRRPVALHDLGQAIDALRDGLRSFPHVHVSPLLATVRLARRSCTRRSEIASAAQGAGVVTNDHAVHTYRTSDHGTLAANTNDNPMPPRPLCRCPNPRIFRSHSRSTTLRNSSRKSRKHGSQPPVAIRGRVSLVPISLGLRELCPAKLAVIVLPSFAVRAVRSPHQLHA